MRIAHISPALPWDFLESIGATKGRHFPRPLEQKLRLVGGGGVYPVGLCQALSKTVDIDLIAPAPFDASYKVKEGLRVHLRRAWYGSPFSTSNPFALPPRRVLQACDVIHVHQIHKALSNASLIVGREKIAYATDHAGGGLSVGLYDGYVAHLAVSDYSARLLRDRFSRSEVILGGAHTPKKGVPSTDLEEMLGGTDRPILLFVGVFRRNKFVDDLISCTYRLHEMGQEPLLVLCGEAWTQPEMSRLRSLVPKKLEEDILFTGFLGEDEKQSLYRACDIFVSASAYEYLGLVFIEAMMWGKPVVARHVGGIPEVVISGKTGFLFDENGVDQTWEEGKVLPERHTEMLSQYVANLIDNPRLARTMGKAGRARAMSLFTWDAVARRTLRLYEMDAEA